VTVEISTACGYTRKPTPLGRRTRKPTFRREMPPICWIKSLAGRHLHTRKPTFRTRRELEGIIEGKKSRKQVSKKLGGGLWRI
jgi:hypothetical protein